jgi:hypothetical protein
MCFRDVASKWGTTVGGLALFITSEDGLQTIATAELAAALRIRLTALNLLPSVVEALGYIVMEYSREERRIPLENSLRRIRLLELKRRNAHRAGALIFKLAHFNPRPIKSYTVRPNPPPTPPGGTAVALDSRGLEHENHACAEPQACHTNETSQVIDSVVVPSAQTCGMPKRPLGHGEAVDNFSASASLRLTEIDRFVSISAQATQDARFASTNTSTTNPSSSSSVPHSLASGP